ncbi:hypothetical protein SAICODRAFT_27046 [Saitoella complicata NRRL Y-17804]|uniref:uncharacterized protein n=1 Tax=Saitoella complicata (strain BCRC 22490 / CBS 7301 / JCM 7358 / NBRC 10748 / NRRL Y-17804) TaxID=698492 RepID=UPI0008677E2B|nr:uncharacterized protein SAICODRAFT_27046 [Saitoella complicata NRRL Y-17804]ODQ50970.1 hypothetical protein SAICODRAFT_27046 [Saitoella complicata NRRL Y-17804]
MGKQRDTPNQLRALLVLNNKVRRTPHDTATFAHVQPSTVYRVNKRYKDTGSHGALARSRPPGNITPIVHRRLQELYKDAVYAYYEEIADMLNEESAAVEL